MTRLPISLLLAVFLVPVTAQGASTAQQDYDNAVRLTADPDRGARTFSSCAVCHGAYGGGSADGRVPRIAGQHRRVVIRQLVDYRHEKRWDPVMEHMADDHLLPDAQAIADVAGFVTSLSAPVPAGTGQASYLDVGRQTYGARCSGCHGAKGQGDEGKAVPRLAGQHYAYLLRQFYDAIDGRRPQLSRSHEGPLHKLDRDALQGMADLLSRY